MQKEKGQIAKNGTQAGYFFDPCESRETSVVRRSIHCELQSVYPSHCWAGIKYPQPAPVGELPERRRVAEFSVESENADLGPPPY